MLTSSKYENQFLASSKNTFTYRDLERFTDFFGAFLHDQKRPDTRPVGLLTNSCDAAVFIVAACWKLTIPFVCFNPKTKKLRLQKQIDALKPAVIFTDLPDLKHNIAGNFRDINAITFKKISTQSAYQKKNLGYSAKQKEEQVFGYFFTSGTTGEPKIVPLKRRQMITSARASAKNMRPAPNNYWLLCMPLHHVGGIAVILRSLIYGSAVYRMKRFDAVTVSTLLSHNRQIVAASLVPTMLKRLLEDPSFTVHQQFEAILLGGGSISSSLLEECLNRNVPVIASYGMTETCAQISAQPIKPKKNITGSVGSLFAPNLIEIRDTDENRVKTGTSGLIWLKGPQVFDSYYNSPKNQFDTDGWFKTGDFGRIDKEDRLYIEARRMDLIITGGENVSPFEVENALKKITEIQDAAIVGLPDEEWGEMVSAVIVLKKDCQITSDKIRQKLKTSLEVFKIPKKFIFVDELPRNEGDKLNRSELCTYF